MAPPTEGSPGAAGLVPRWSVCGVSKAALPDCTRNFVPADRVAIATNRKQPCCCTANPPWPPTGVCAAHTGISKSTVARYFARFGLQPHRSKSFKLSTDPFFVEKVRDIVGLYLNPPDNALVLCVDEKRQVQALERTQPVLPMGLGDVAGVVRADPYDMA